MSAVINECFINFIHSIFFTVFMGQIARKRTAGHKRVDAQIDFCNILTNSSLYRFYFTFPLLLDVPAFPQA